ncbi:MAG: NADH-quinone oxidoreductase subunit NuoH [Bacteroidia bacterium]|nr:NADH-quinone oxidoreductase subunit NuoH [Bacteroidia bacterium]MDW8159349.1 NADH-quinone oxidoreductase subunit NuoH [Bacteroidia bacterium]
MVFSFILAIIVVSGVALFALLAVYGERKIAAFIQNRLGPIEVGPYGLLQTLADILKLLQKQLVINASANKPLFVIAPIVIFLAIFLGLAAIPLGPRFIGVNLNIGLVYIIGIVSIEVIGILMTGWGSNNKYSLIGAVRSVSQIISYEIPAGLALLSAVIMYSSLDLFEICELQGIAKNTTLWAWGFWEVQEVGGFFSWGIFRYPHLLLPMIVYFIASLAECNRAPFDLPEAESELVAGYLTEYSGFRFALIMLAEYANMLLVSFLFVILFWGGYQSPFPNLGATLENGTTWVLVKNLQLATLTNGPFWGVFWLLLKASIVVLIQMWVRWSYPRLRADQLMILCWKYLTPLALFSVFISATWKVLEIYFGS